MVIDCFVKGDLKEIFSFIDDKLIKNFQSVIDERLEEQETLKIDVIKMNKIEIKEVKTLKNFLRISVLLKLSKLKSLKIRKAKLLMAIKRILY